MNKNEVKLLIEKKIRTMVRKDSRIHNAYLLLHSEKLDFHLNIAEGVSGDISANPQQPHFIASIGKLFTAVLIGILVEKGKISYGDSITQFLDKEILNDLHVFKGKDYTNEIKVKHLLNHTSGLHDYFDDKPKHGKSMIHHILNEPARFWTPQETIQWSKNHLRSHFPPGEGFHYSDTGYHLLGLIIEKVTSRSFHDALQHYIFEPLEMKHTHLAFHSEPIEKSDYPVAHLFSGKTDVTHFRSLSIDYAGGGIVSTSEDLLKFMKALVSHEIIKEDTFEQMKDWAKFGLGIDYGYGLMNFKTIPFAMPERYNAWGNAGSTGSFMFYHPAMDLYMIGNLNQFRYHRKGIWLMFKSIDMLSKCDHNS